MPAETLKPSVSPSGFEGVETWTCFWTMTPPSFAVSPEFVPAEWLEDLRLVPSEIGARG